RTVGAGIGDSKARIGIREVRMIERIEEFSAELPLEALRHSEHLEKAEIRGLNSWSVECPRSAVSEGPVGGKCECCGVNEEACGRVQGRVGRRACKWIADAIGIGSVARSGKADVRSRDAEGSSGLQSDNSVELPSADQVTREVIAREESLSLADGQVPRVIADKAMADVKRRIAHFSAIVIGICGGRASS